MRGIWIALALLAGSAAYADDAADARSHYEEGTKLYDLGRYKEAAHEYEEAFRSKPDPALLFNIGQAYRQAGDDEAALGAYRGFLRRFPEYENRAEVEGYIRTLQQRLDEKRKAAEKAAPPPTTPPAAAPAAITPAPATTAPVVAAPVAAAPPPREHAPAYKKWWLWTIVGVVVIGGGAAALAVALTTPKNAPSPPGTMTLVFP